MNIFKPGKITFVLDGGAGSSAKGMRAANIWKNYRHKHTTFAANTFLSNAAHTITHADGREAVHQCLSSITTLGEYEKQYISPGAAFSIEEIMGEITEHNLGPDKLGIHPNVAIVTKKDIEYERGIVDFEGNKLYNQESANLRIGSTLHGVGAARARRILRRPDAILAKDIDQLKPYITKTHHEIMSRLKKLESCIGEIAQGYQLSLLSEYWPRTTSRNCSVAAFLDDSMLPPSVCGPVIVNFRTCPIRVNNNKYIRKSDHQILSWAQWNETPENDRLLIEGDSGGHYADQREMTWDEVSEQAGEKIFETTTLTGLPRRIFSFSRTNFLEALTYNDTGDDIYISINFMNYIDGSVRGKQTKDEVLTPKVRKWLYDNVWSPNLIKEYMTRHLNIKGIFIGTWKTIDDSILLTIDDLVNI